jgi:predicted Zn-dependent protease
MATRARLVFVLGLLTLSVVIVATMGHSSSRVNFSAAMQLWGDVIRDADDLGLQLTRVSARKEMELGKRIECAMISESRRQIAIDPYLNTVGNALARNVSRKGIAYKFHVVESPEINAFAVPGGQVFITTAMLGFVRSEAELAGVLGHEISHIDLRHCIGRYQYQLALQGVGVGAVGEAVDLARLPLVVGYTKYQESEADEQGVTLALQAGYDPRAMIDVMARLDRQSGDSAAPQASSGPVTEAASATVEALGTYLRSHPQGYERIDDLNELIATDRSRLGPREVYEGVENYRERIPMTAHRYPGESKKW